MPALLLVILLAACGGGNPSAADSSAAPVVSIAEIQGSGQSSPLAGQIVVFKGIVSGDFQEGDSDRSRNLGGFYLQSASDGDAATSDGVFVFDGESSTVDVTPGDRVRVTGEVVEYFGETQVIPSQVEITGKGDIEATPLALPMPTVANSDGELVIDLEPFEGMLVRFPQTLTVSQLRNQERFGEVLLSEGGRQSPFTSRSSPSTAGFREHVDTIASRRIHLDDGLRTDGTIVPVRGGDEITDLTGVVRFSRGRGPAGTEAYRLMPTVDPRFETANPRPGPPDVAGDLQIATFNVNNFFSTIDSGRGACGPSGRDSCRGADSELELSRQLEKIVTTLSMMDSAIVALVELENNQSASLQMIVAALNAAIGRERYAYIDTGSIGTDAIKVGFIYQPALVRPFGSFAILDGDADPRFDDTLNRPVLAQSFDTVLGGQRITVLALHLKSKGSSCDSAGDPNTGDGQGNCSATRALARGRDRRLGCERPDRERQ